MDLSQLPAWLHSHWLSLVLLLTFLTFILRAYLALIHRPLSLIRHFQKQGIKGPPFRPIIGQVPEVLAGIKETAQTGEVFPNFTKWRQLYGDIFYYMMGTQVRLAILDPEKGYKINAATSGPKALFQKDQHTRTAYEPIFGVTGLIMAANDVWTRQRKLANPLFYHARVKALGPIMVDCTKEMLHKWDEQLNAVGGKGEIEVWAQFAALARDILCGAVFGDPKGAASVYSGQDIYADVGQLMEDVTASLLGLGPKLIPGYKYIPTAQNKRIARLRQNVHDMLNHVIDQRREAGLKAAKVSGGGPDFGDDLLGRLLSATDEQGNLSSEELMDQCKTFFFAGHETISTCLAWTLMLLAQHPEWADRARDEVRTVCGDNFPDVGSLADLKVLSMVVSESLRLYPPAFLSARQAVAPTTIEGIHIPADRNLVLVLPTVSYQRDPKVWGEDAAAFRPDRFADSVKSRSHAYSPFMIGPRTCIGRGFALQEVKIVVTALLQRYNFRISTGYKHSPNIGVTITPKYGVPLIVERL